MANGTASTRGSNSASSTKAPAAKSTAATPQILQKYSAYVAGADYRNGLPFALKKQLKADGWDMDPAALAAEANSGESIEFLDLQTGETYTYKKTVKTEINPLTDTEYEVSEYKMTAGSSSEVNSIQKPYGVDGLIVVPNGTVARPAKKSK